MIEMKSENINMKASIGYSSHNNDILPEEYAQQLGDAEQKSEIKEMEKEEED
jgi:hypothetical protein